MLVRPPREAAWRASSPVWRRLGRPTSGRRQPSRLDQGAAGCGECQVPDRTAPGPWSRRRRQPTAPRGSAYRPGALQSGKQPATAEAIRAQGADPDRAHWDHIAAMKAVPGRASLRHDDHPLAPAAATSGAAGRRGSYAPSPSPCSVNLPWTGLFPEYKDQRSGGFQPLRFVRQNSVVVLGVLTRKPPYLESMDDLQSLISAAPSSSTWISRRCPRSAASHPGSREASSRWTTSGPSFAWRLRRPSRSGRPVSRDRDLRHA
jgi:hypothetical protein